MKCHLPRFFHVLGVCVVIVSLAVVPAFAVQSSTPEEILGSFDSLAFTAVPPRTEVIEVKPGDTYQTNIKLRNLTKQSQAISTEALDFVIDKDGKTPIPVTQTEAAPLRWSLASWITVSPAQRAVAPNELAVYDVVIQVPEDALPGGHYAMVVHTPVAMSALQNKPQEKNAQSASVVSPKLGTLFYVKVAGNVHEEAFIRSFTAPSWVEFGPVDFSYSVENLSDVHITPQSSIVVKDMIGRTVDTIVVEPSNIFPYSTRTFTAMLDKIWGVGPYTAHLSVPYGTGGKVLTTTLVFWMFPYRIVLAVLVILMTVLAIAIVIRRHLEHRYDMKSKQIEVLEERIRELEERSREQ